VQVIFRITNGYSFHGKKCSHMCLLHQGRATFRVRCPALSGVQARQTPRLVSWQI
jgi:hypothetical protein